MNDQRDDGRIDGRSVRVAVIAGGAGAGDAVMHTLARLREWRIDGYEIEVIGIEALGQGRYDVVHVCAPGPAGIAALQSARALGVPVLGSCAAELQAFARLRSGDPRGEQRAGAQLARFYRHCGLVLSPSRFADALMVGLGVPAERIARWEPAVDLVRFHPARYSPDALVPQPQPRDGVAGRPRFSFLYAGRLSREQGIDLLAEAFLIARDRDPRLHLVLAGRGPQEGHLRARLGPAATFLGRLDGDALAAAYASADLFVLPSATDIYGQVILEAQASGLPVLAVDAGGAAELIKAGRSGCLVPPDPEALAGAMRGLALRAALRDRLATGGLLAAHERSWEHSLAQLAAAYAGASRHHGAGEVARAA